MRTPTVYCIGLAGDARRERMRRRLAHHGLLKTTEFVDAVPSEGPHDASEASRARAGAACVASHLKAMRRMLEHPDGHRAGALICEDDVLLHNGFLQRLDGVLGNLPADAPYCSLGYLVSDWSRDFRWAGRDPGRHNVCGWVPGALWGTHLYWISAAFAERVLDAYGDIEPSRYPPIMERTFGLAPGFAAFPSLGIQDVIDSRVRPPADLEFHFRGQAAWRYSDYSACEQGSDLSPLRHQEGLPRPTIGLCMIVRDEAAVIARCLHSVLPLIDSWQICDTGSHDATRAIVTGALSGVPGQLHERPWRDFGWNRSELMTLAAGSADYLLLLDADMTLDWRGPLPPLESDAYLLRHAGDLDYAIPRLVRGSRRWRYEGSTHEYLATEGAFTQTVLEALLVEHHADGGSRAEKFGRDAQLLERDLARRPDDGRAAFYLAQTYRDLGEDERAIELYQQRAALGGWEEEVFYSLYQAGVLLARRDDERAAAALLEAWRRRPQRAEPLYELVRLLRFRGRHEDAYGFAQRTVEIGYPDDLLFVHRWIYDWGLRYELSVTAFWVGEVDRALAVSEDLLHDDRLPPDVAAAARENIGYCLAAGAVRSHPARDGGHPHRAPARLGELCRSFVQRPLAIDASPPWPQFNPTIGADGDGFRVIVRTANYELVDGRYRFLTGDHVVRTINYSARLDRDLSPIGAEPLLDASDAPPVYPGSVRGYEDCRLVRLTDGWAATATVRDRNPVERCETALLTLSGSRMERIESVDVLRSPWPGRHEKNWMPFAVDGTLHVLYSCDPTVVLRYDGGAAAPARVAELPGPPGASRLRGGSQGVRIGDGLLFVVHEAAEDDGRRIYTHRFLLLDGAYAIAGVSPPFSFAGPGIEFCAGMARDRDRLLLTYGIGDRAAALGVLELAEVTRLLEGPQLWGQRRRRLPDVARAAPARRRS